jgi:hypothetical protein
MVTLARFGHCPPQEPTILLIAAVHAPCLLWVKTRMTSDRPYVSFRQLRTSDMEQPIQPAFLSPALRRFRRGDCSKIDGGQSVTLVPTIARKCPDRS